MSEKTRTREGVEKFGKFSFFLNENHLNVILYAGADYRYVLRQNIMLFVLIRKASINKHERCSFHNNFRELLIFFPPICQKANRLSLF